MKMNMTMNKSKFKNLFGMIFIIATFFSNTLFINAQAKDIELVGGYRHPSTGVIEDSGGESSYALGQSMVDKIVNKDAKYDSNSEYGSIVEFEMNMMDSMSDITFQVQENEKSEFKDTQHGQQVIDNTVSKFQVPVSSPNAIIKATCFVKPMGRSVVFYIYSNSDIAVDEQTQIQNTTDSNNLGLTIGGPGITNYENSQEIQNQETNEENKEEAGFKIDDSVWITLSMLIFSIVVLSSALVVVIFVLSKRILKRKNIKVNKLREDEFNLEDNLQEDTHDDIELDFDATWEEEYEE